MNEFSKYSFQIEIEFDRESKFGKRICERNILFFDKTNESILLIKHYKYVAALDLRISDSSN